MANPQIENGFTRIANELLEALYRVNLSPYETRVMFFIWRKTYGYNKKTDKISLAQFSKALQIDRRRIHRTIKRLEARQLIVLCRGDNKLISYGFQKDYSKWKLSPTERTRKPVLCGEDKVSSAEGTKVSSVEAPTKERKKKERVRDPHGVTPTNPKSVGRGVGGFKETMALYSDLFTAKVGAKPDIDGRDGKILSGLLKSHGQEEVQDVLRFFFKNPPEWVAAKGKFTLYTLKGLYNELLACWKKDQETASIRKEIFINA